MPPPPFFTLFLVGWNIKEAVWLYSEFWRPLFFSKGLSWLLLHHLGWSQVWIPKFRLALFWKVNGPTSLCSSADYIHLGTMKRSFVCSLQGTGWHLWLTLQNILAGISCRHRWELRVVAKSLKISAIIGDWKGTLPKHMMHFSLPGVSHKTICQESRWEIKCDEQIWALNCI